MVNLKDFSVAETMFILNPSTAQVSIMMKLTLMDLIFKKVLAIQQDFGQNERLAANYLLKGPAFDKYTPAVWENVFMELFNDDSLKIQIKFITKALADRLKSITTFYYGVTKSDRIQVYFSQNKIIKYLGINRFNDKGKQLKKDINRQLVELAKQLHGMRQQPAAAFRKVLEQLESKVFLITELDYNVLYHYNTLIDQANQRPTDLGTSPTWDPLLYLNIDYAIHHINAAFDYGIGGDGGRRKYRSAQEEAATGKSMPIEG